MAEWQKQAEALFFRQHSSIGAIAAITGKARETVSRFLTERPEYGLEKEYRKLLSKAKRQHYDRDRKRHDRLYNPTITGESVRREHENAVRVLSAENRRYDEW